MRIEVNNTDDMDFLFCDYWTRLYLGGAVKFISITVPEDEIQKIKDNQIYLLKTMSPAHETSNIVMLQMEYDFWGN